MMVEATQCFEKNPCVKEEKSYSLPDCVEEDETEAVAVVVAPDAGASLLEAFCPMEYMLQ